MASWDGQLCVLLGEGHLATLGNEGLEGFPGYDGRFIISVVI
jgi:hypothetical protein